MVQVLLLNPEIDSNDPLVSNLKKQGIHLFVVSGVKEAWLTLQMYQKNIDLVVVQREGRDGKTPSGFELIDLVAGELPVIISSSQWTDEQFLAHQESPQGVNGYLRFPFEGHFLQAMIENILGKSEQKPLPVILPIRSESDAVEKKDHEKRLKELTVELNNSKEFFSELGRLFSERKKESIELSSAVDSIEESVGQLRRRIDAV